MPYSTVNLTERLGCVLTFSFCGVECAVLQGAGVGAVARHQLSPMGWSLWRGYPVEMKVEHALTFNYVTGLPSQARTKGGSEYLPF